MQQIYQAALHRAVSLEISAYQNAHPKLFWISAQHVPFPALREHLMIPIFALKCVQIWSTTPILTRAWIPPKTAHSSTPPKDNTRACPSALSRSSSCDRINALRFAWASPTRTARV